jgi:uncharacterized membrane protein HdeD (DUF308 family)
MEAAVRYLSQHWWMVLLQGVVSIVLGVLALVWPNKTLGLLVILFGLFALLNGAIEIYAAISAARLHQPWGWRLAAGLFGVLAGVVIFRWPSITAFIVLFVVGLWAIGTGIVAIVSAIAERTVLRNTWLAALVALAGVISVLFGIAMFVWPAAGVVTLALLVGIYAIVYGVMYCAVAFRLRSLPGRSAGPSAPPTAAPAA